jgi:LIVCS family branched-chain amino acid:cation transporter
MQKRTSAWALGLAIFTMLFGAGNVVFPLLIGRAVGNQVLYAVLGFIATAVIVPLLGLISAMLFEGDYKKYLANMGTIPGIIITAICMILLGLFAAPRCIALSYATIQWYVPQCSILLYSVIASMLIFTLTVRKSKVVEILGRYIGPIKLTLLLAIIVLGLVFPYKPVATDFSPWQSFMKGLLDGYFTMDLLGTVFFSSLVYATIKHQMMGQDETVSSLNVAIHGLKAGVIGGLLLGLVYVGFCVVAAMYGPHVHGITEAQLLSALATTILGNYAGIIANFAVVVACFATALALTTVFAEYLHNDIFRKKINYIHALLITIVLVFAMTNIGFSGIIRLMAPILGLCYPALIVLAIANILTSLFGFRYTKYAVFSTFLITAYMQYGDAVIKYLS